MIWYRSTLFHFWIFRAICSITRQPKRPLPVGKWFDQLIIIILKAWITNFQSECGCLKITNINPPSKKTSPAFLIAKKSSGNVQKTTICNSKLPRKFLGTLYGRSLPPLLVEPVLYRFFFWKNKAQLEITTYYCKVSACFIRNWHGMLIVSSPLFVFRKHWNRLRSGRDGEWITWCHKVRVKRERTVWFP